MKIDAIKLAHEAGLSVGLFNTLSGKVLVWDTTAQDLERFAAAILDECQKACHPNFTAEHPPGRGKDDRFDLGRMHCV